MTGFGGGARRARGQGGFVLGLVLAAMIVGLILITALLGLSFTTHRAAIAQQDLAQDRRAADGALEAAVQTVRSGYSPATDPCSLVPASVPMDASGDNDLVALECNSVLDPNPEATGSLKVVGESLGSDQTEEATLRHDGPQALSAVGPVVVKKGAELSGADPALLVSGLYAQGDNCTADLAVQDADGSPDCDSPEAKSLAPSEPSVTRPAFTSTTKAELSTCGTPLKPGEYPAAWLPDLNALLATPGCVVEFMPGTYWFNGQRLEFGGADVRFGTLGAGGCEATATVVLAAGTAFTHTAGDVVVCGDLLQAAGGSSEVHLVNAASAHFSNPAGLLEVDPATPPKTNTCAPVITWVGSTPIRTGATCETRSFSADVLATGDSAIGSLELVWNSVEWPRALVLDRRISVVLANETDELCRFAAPVPRGRVGWGYGSSIDLVDQCPGLAGTLETALQDAQLTVSFSFADLGSAQNLCFVSVYCPFTIDVADVRLLLNSRQADATSASSDGSWSNPARLLAADGESATTDDCGIWVGATFYGSLCNRTGETTGDRTFKLEDFAEPAGTDPNQSIEGLSVVFDAAATDTDDVVASFGASSSPKITATLSQALPDGGSVECPIIEQTYPRSSRPFEIEFESCNILNGQLTVGDLGSLSVSVAVTPEKGTYVGPTYYANYGVEIPPLEHVRLRATLGPAAGIVQSGIVADEAGGNSFRVIGDTVLPRTDLAVDWTTATPSALFDGGLEVNALVSSSGAGDEVGVICCGTANPMVRIDGFVDTNPDGSKVENASITGLARIRVKPLESGVEVLDWQLCLSSGCDPGDAIPTG